MDLYARTWLKMCKRKYKIYSFQAGFSSWSSIMPWFGFFFFFFFSLALLALFLVSLLEMCIQPDLYIGNVNHSQTNKQNSPFVFWNAIKTSCNIQVEQVFQNLFYQNIFSAVRIIWQICESNHDQIIILVKCQFSCWRIPSKMLIQWDYTCKLYEIRNRIWGIIWWHQFFFQK